MSLPVQPVDGPDEEDDVQVLPGHQDPIVSVQRKDVRSTRGGRRPAVLSVSICSALFSLTGFCAQDLYTDCEREGKDGVMEEGRQCRCCGERKFYRKGRLVLRAAYGADKMGHHTGRECKKVTLSILRDLLEEGCRNKLVMDRKEQMEVEEQARQAIVPAEANTPMSMSCSSMSRGTLATWVEPPAKKRRTQAQLAWTCTASNASTILWFMTRWLLACALSFQTVECGFFRDMIRVLNPAFYERYFPKTTWVFTHTYLQKVYLHVKQQVFRVLQWGGTELRTLAGDGVKMPGNQHWINYTIGNQAGAVFKDCIRQVEANSVQYHADQWILQLRKDIDGTELTDAEVERKYAAIVGDNVC